MFVKLLIFLFCFLLQPISGVCKAGDWNLDLQICIEPIQKGYPYSQVKSTCLMFNNGTLFSIHDIFTHNLLVQQARYYALTDFFVGATKVNGTWQWEDGTPFNYSRWAQNEPSKNGDCISVGVSWSQWYAIDCKSKSEGLCQSQPTNNL